MEQITLGKRYPLSSLLHGSSLSRQTNGELTTLQYVFKPSSVDPNQIGSLRISATNEALIALPTIDTEVEKESFKGIATKPSNEFILSFDGGNFQLERVVSAVTNIRHCRNESTFSIKDVSVANSRKFHEQSLLLRAGPRPAKRKRITKLDAAKSSIKEPTATINADDAQIKVQEDPASLNCSSTK
jgi:RNA polymerase II transcription elongation factor